MDLVGSLTSAARRVGAGAAALAADALDGLSRRLRDADADRRRVGIEHAGGFRLVEPEEATARPEPAAGAADETSPPDPVPLRTSNPKMARKIRQRRAAESSQTKA